MSKNTGWALVFGCIAATTGIYGSSLALDHMELSNRHAALLVEVEDKRRELAALRKQVIRQASVQQEADRTLAAKNRNPLNIKAVRGGWRGQVGVDKFGHAIFSSEEHGIRAAASVLMSYAVKHRLDTVADIVNRFCTGNREAYIKFVSRRLGVGQDEPFNVLERMPELLQAMARFESGREWPKENFVAYGLLHAAYQKGGDK